MFGISFPELLIVVILLVVVTKPKDIPAIARYLTKLFFKAKQIIAGAKREMLSVSNELGLEKIKEEAQAEIEKQKKEINKTVIIDLYGNEHEVHDVDKIRGDLAPEDLEKEIEELNKSNIKKKKIKKKQGAKKSKKS